MTHDSLRIEIDGSEVPELYDDLLTLEVELDDELTGDVPDDGGPAAAGRRLLGLPRRRPLQRSGAAWS